MLDCQNLSSFLLALCHYFCMKVIYGHGTLIFLKSVFFQKDIYIVSVTFTRFDLSGTSDLCPFRVETHNYTCVSNFQVLLLHVLSHDLEWDKLKS